MQKMGPTPSIVECVRDCLNGFQNHAETGSERLNIQLLGGILLDAK